MIDFRQLFRHQTWWGKVIGACLGYLIAGPIGAFFGIFIGNLFDRGLAEHFSRPHWSYHTEKRDTVQRLFLETMFAVMGYVAKADGRVSEQEIEMAITVMQELRLNGLQKKKARHFFNEGKKQTFELNRALSTLYQATYDNAGLLNLFVNIQYRIAQIDGLSAPKQAAMNTILSHLGFAPLQQQYHFYETFNYQPHYQYHRASSNQHTEGTQKHSTLDHAYAILNIAQTATKQEVKSAYRRLISQNHPDKLIARGLPEKTIKMANEKTQRIRKAYEEICAYKGW